MISRLLLPFVAVALSTGSGYAADKRVGAAAEKVAESAFLLVGISYLCSDAIGDAHFHASRLMAEHAIKGLGETEDDAVIVVDDFAQRAKREHPVKAPAQNAGKCMDGLLSAQSDLKVAQARFRKLLSELKPSGN